MNRVSKLWVRSNCYPSFGFSEAALSLVLSGGYHAGLVRFWKEVLRRLFKGEVALVHVFFFFF